MCWDTDANDVDLHVTDPNGETCYYSHASTRSGLRLYSDQTQGLGPEVIRSARTIPGRYRVGVRYYNQGAMGESRGVLVVLRQVNGKQLGPTVHPFTLRHKDNRVIHVTGIEFQAFATTHAQEEAPAARPQGREAGEMSRGTPSPRSPLPFPLPTRRPH
jgi:hypothetical protein